MAGFRLNKIIVDEETALLMPWEGIATFERKKWAQRHPWANRLEWAGLVLLPIAFFLALYCIFRYCDDLPQGQPRCARPSFDHRA